MRVTLKLFALSAVPMLCSCYGTFHTARVVPFSGGLQAMTVDGQVIHGAVLDAGIPASSWPGVGFSLSAFTRGYMAYGLMAGARVQAPANDILDVAVEQDFSGGAFPARTALLFSRRVNGWEPYMVLGHRPVWDDSDEGDDDWLNPYDWMDSEGSSTTVTLGCLYSFRQGFGPRLGGEVEYGRGMVAPMAGLTLQYGF